MGKIFLEEPKKKSRYKEEPKKPWILAYYALMSGTQKRQARLTAEKNKPLDFGVKEREAAKARRELELENFQPIKLPPVPNAANQTDKTS